MAIAYPTPLGGNPYKMTAFYNDQQWGWSDTFYYSTSKLFDSNDLLNMAQAFAQRFNTANASDVLLQGVRVTALDPLEPLLKSAGQSQLFTPTQLNIGTPATGFPSQSPWAAGLLTIPDTSGTFKRPWLVRGLTDLWMSPRPGVAAANLTGANSGLALPNAQFLQWIVNNNLKLFGGLVNGVVGAKTFTGAFALRARNRNPAATFPSRILGVALAADNQHLVYTVNANIGLPSPPYTVGQRIIVRGAKFVCGKGGNGSMSVTAVAAGTLSGTWLVTTTAKWCCYPQLPVLKVGGYGTLSLAVYGLFGLGNSSFERIVKRDTGRPTFGTAGRRSAKCC